MIDNIFEWLETAGVKYENTPEQKQLGITLLDEEITELKDAIKHNNKQGILDGISDSVWILANNLLFNGLFPEDLSDYMTKVSVSNWSKFCSTEMIAQMTIDAYQKGEHPDKPGQKIDCYYERVDSMWVVKRSNDNKVLKSIYYKPVSEL